MRRMEPAELAVYGQWAPDLMLASSIPTPSRPESARCSCARIDSSDWVGGSSRSARRPPEKKSSSSWR